jgi:hypothetical protein
MDLLDRYTGCLLGLACGDAVGTTVEFENAAVNAAPTDPGRAQGCGSAGTISRVSR